MSLSIVFWVALALPLLACPAHGNGLFTGDPAESVAISSRITAAEAKRLGAFVESFGPTIVVEMGEVGMSARRISERLSDPFDRFTIPVSIVFAGLAISYAIRSTKVSQE